MRKPPQAQIKDVPTEVPARDDIVAYERKYELITPLFGGGVRAGETDPITVVNGKSIRGQLRFWWRAMRGGQFDGDLQKMRAVERMIWGAASTEDQSFPSVVQTTVKIDAAGQPVPYHGLPAELKYGAFPLQQHNGTVSRGVKFTLLVDIKHNPICSAGMSFEQIQLEIEAALWAWETFGGVGGRTRRGFGAIKLHRWSRNGISQILSWQATDFESALEILEAGFDDHLIDDCIPPHIPHLAFDTRIQFHTRRPSGEAALGDLLEALRRFRQGHRNPATRPPRPGERRRPPGRSKWPEPETIREITRQRLAAGLRSAGDMGHPPIQAYTGQRLLPRAQFGLPIVFEFHQDDRHPSDANRDHRKTVLQMSHEDSEGRCKPVKRWASPLILRPLFVGPNLYVGMAVFLEGSRPPFDVALYEANAETLLQNGLSMDLSPSQAGAITSLGNAPPLNVRGETEQSYVDVVLDFLDTL